FTFFAFETAPSDEVVRVLVGALPEERRQEVVLRAIGDGERELEQTCLLQALRAFPTPALAARAEELARKHPRPAITKELREFF
ncbi:hypothetical protein ABLW52_24070, partial [Salmonella enterica]|uniref:hypothetical protein n=1 Tax=Salmonella enterica TaxID=28901 RepID=UPI0032B5C2B0